MIGQRNEAALDPVENDYEALRDVLSRRGVEIDKLKERAKGFELSISTTSLSMGGTRYGRFAVPGEPRNIFDRLDDCSIIHQLTGVTPRISLHLPWDRHDEPAELRSYAEARGLAFDSINSTTFQDLPGQPLAYRFGSLSHTDAEVRKQAVQHNIACIELGKAIGCKALLVWTGEGGSLPGQTHLAHAFDRHLASLREIYEALPQDWRLLTAHALHGQALYAPVLQDWGANYLASAALGDRASCLVDLSRDGSIAGLEGAIVRLIQQKKLGGFRFNDAAHGDDRLGAGWVQPYRLFLLFNELADSELAETSDFRPVHIIDHAPTVTDPIESLIVAATEVLRAHVQAYLVDRAALAKYQEENDALMASETLKQAFRTDVEPILAMARHEKEASVDPVATYRASGHQVRSAEARPRVSPREV